MSLNQEFYNSTVLANRYFMTVRKFSIREYIRLNQGDPLHPTHSGQMEIFEGIFFVGMTRVGRSATDI